MLWAPSSDQRNSPPARLPSLWPWFPWPLVPQPSGPNSGIEPRGSFLQLPGVPALCRLSAPHVISHTFFKWRRDIHNLKFTILTISKRAVQGHRVHSHYCAAGPSIHLCKQKAGAQARGALAPPRCPPPSVSGSRPSTLPLRDRDRDRDPSRGRAERSHTAFVPL